MDSLFVWRLDVTGQYGLDTLAVVAKDDANARELAKAAIRGHLRQFWAGKFYDDEQEKETARLAEIDLQLDAQPRHEVSGVVFVVGTS